MLGPPILKRQGDVETVKMLFHLLDAEYKKKGNEHQTDILRHLLVALVLKLNTLRDKEPGRISNSGWLNLLNRLDKAMEDDSLRLRDARMYANRLGCSYKHLNTVCKSLTGQTVKQYIDQVIVLEIKRCLATTALSIKELCWRFGFDEETNFVKFFKKHAGMSPKRFQNQQLK